MKVLTPEQRTEFLAQIKAMSEALDKIYKRNELLLAYLDNGQRPPVELLK